MTDQLLTDRELALLSIEESKFHGAFTYLEIMLRAVQMERHQLESQDVANAVSEAWERFYAFNLAMTVEQCAAAVARVARFLPKQTAVGIAAAAFGETAVDVTVLSGDRIKWLPEDDLLILTFADATVAHSTVPTGVVMVRERTFTSAR